MKRLIPTLALCAFVLALAAPLALAAGAAATPAKPATPAHQAKAMSTKATATEHKAMGRMESTRKERVDLNSASKEELMKLPGMTDAWADKIVADRPYKSRTELLHKKVVPATEYGKIRSWVTAKQAGAEKK